MCAPTVPRLKVFNRLGRVLCGRRNTHNHFLAREGSSRIGRLRGSPTCVAALGGAIAKGAPIALHINRCMMEPPLEEDPIFSQSGRPFIKHCQLRDRTGGVDVDVVHAAVPALFGCSTDAELKENVRVQSLTSARQRMNVRGVSREEGGGHAEVYRDGGGCVARGGRLCRGHASRSRSARHFR